MAPDGRDTREAMLDAVAEMVDEGGIRELSLREVARRTGVSHATPGHHFGDKDGMLAAFAERGFRLFTAQFAVQEAGMLDGRAYIRFATEHRPYFEVMFRSGLDRSKHPGLSEGSTAVFESLVSAVADLQASGVGTEYPAKIIAIRLWALVHGLASLVVDGQLTGIVEVNDDVIDTVLEAEV